MNPANLPFDSETMLQGLRAWVECESPTWDARAVDRMLDLAAREMAIMGATIERIAGRQGFAGCVRARFPHPKQGEPGILIAGHLDTVHPVGTLEKLAWRREGNKCYGPGIFDMKGGNYLTLEADPATGPRRVHDAAADHRAVHAGRRGRHAVDPRHHRGRSRPQQICAGAGAGPRQQRRGHRAICHCPLQSRSHRQAEPCRRHALIGPFRDPRDGTPDYHYRRHDDRRLHLLGRHRAWRPMGQLRCHHLHRRGAQHGQTTGRPRSRRRTDARAFREQQ